MDKKQQEQAKKLTLNKETLQQLKVKTNIKAGAMPRSGVGGACGTT